MEFPKTISEWFEAQKPGSVVDVKLAILDKSFSNREIEESFLHAEKEVALGNVHETPPPSRAPVNPLVQEMLREA